jgi:AraC-like DNA-binding protein
VSGVVKHLLDDRLRPMVLAYLTTVSPRSVHELVPLVKAGIERVVIAGVDDDPARLRSCAPADPVEVAASEAVRQARAVAAEDVFPLVRFVLEHPRSDASASEIASVLGCSRRTLSKRAAKIGLRGVRAVRIRGRLLIAITLMVQSRHSAEEAALSSGLSSASQFGSALRRHTGSATRDVIARPEVAHWAFQLFGTRSGESATLEMKVGGE